jgi:uncharacterized protein YrzB (UPF0473 family)
MADMKDNVFEEGESDFEGTAIFTLTDDDGNEQDFALVGSLEVEEAVYMALIPVDEKGLPEGDEHVILKCIEEDGEKVLVTIDDDEEFDRVVDMFNDELFFDISYDD